MIVTIIADVLGKENNGTTIACMNLIRYLKSVKDEVRIVCCDEEQKGQDNYHIVPTYNLGRVLNTYLDKNGVKLAKPDEDILRNAINGSDVVHIMIPFNLGRKAIGIAKEYNIPITAGFHCQAENFTSHLFLMNVSYINHLTYKNFYNHFYKYVDAIHYPTQFIQEVFEKQIKKKTNGYVISNGVNERYKPIICKKPPELKYKFIILFIGRYSKEKSHELLIKAVSKSKYNKEIQLIFAGGGPLKEKLIKLSQKQDINMPIMEFFSREELVKVINYSDLYCHPAQIEIEAISCLEAISCGLVPLINNSPRSATRHFALTKNNLFNCNDVDDLTLKIEYWIEHQQERKLCSKKYLNFTDRFNQVDCMKKMREMFVKEVKKNGKKNKIL